MEVCDGCSSPFTLGRGAFRCVLTGVQRVPSMHPTSLYLCSQMPFYNSLKSSAYRGALNCFLKSPRMPVKKGNLGVCGQELRKVIWIVEADISDGQLLYITGDLSALGCWAPEMATVMSPYDEDANLWMAEIEVPCGSNFKYNYFIKGDKWASCDLVWRPGPGFSLSIPVPCENSNNKILVRDSWMKACTERLPVPSWGSWLVEVDLSVGPTKPKQYHAPASGKKNILESPISNPLSWKAYSNDESHFLEKEISKDFGLNSLQRIHQPVEEPWFFQSAVLCNNESGKKLAGIIFADEGPEEESKLAQAEDPISTVILINSSVCTVQRIAILEDGKLVELLLEPVKNNVQCGSVYLGVVTKLVPHLGGAFVDIGTSRPSLMDIKHNREPFVYPPFRQKPKDREVNGSLVKEPKVNFNTLTDETALHEEDEALDDFLEVELPEYSEDREIDDELDLSDTLNKKANGGGFDYGAGEVDFEDYLEGSGNQVEDETIPEFLPSEMGGFNDCKLSNHMLQDLTMVANDARFDADKWGHVRKGTKVIVQVVKEGLGTKGPALTPYPSLKSRFWVLGTRCDRIGVSKKITGVERTRLRVIAKTLQPLGFGLTVRTVAAGHSLEELQKDMEGLLSTWKDIIEHAKSAALAADEGVEGAIPIILHRAMGQTLSVVQDYFNEKVDKMVVDSPRTYHEITRYLQEIAPDLCGRVELYDKRIPIFDDYCIEEEINNILNKRVPLSNGGSLVIEQTEALVSIDVNGGHGMLGQGISQEQAIVDVNLAAAKQIARELRLRDIGGIIVVDFIDMVDDSNKRLVYEEMKKAVVRDQSMVRVSELSRHGLMEITRKRVRPSVTFMISEPCTYCHATGRIEAMETSFSKIEHEICRLLALSDQKPDPENAKSWPRFVLRVDRYMCNYLTSGKRTKLAILSSSLKVWILLKVARGFARGIFEIKTFTDEKANNDQQQVAISRLRGTTESGSYIPSTKLTLFPVKKWKTRGK